MSCYRAVVLGNRAPFLLSTPVGQRLQTRPHSPSSLRSPYQITLRLLIYILQHACLLAKSWSQVRGGGVGATSAEGRSWSPSERADATRASMAHRSTEQTSSRGTRQQKPACMPLPWHVQLLTAGPTLANGWSRVSFGRGREAEDDVG